MDRRGAATRRPFCLTEAPTDGHSRRFLGATGGQPLAAFWMLLDARIMVLPPLLPGQRPAVAGLLSAMAGDDLWSATRDL